MDTHKNNKKYTETQGTSRDFDGACMVSLDSLLPGTLLGMLVMRWKEGEMG